MQVFFCLVEHHVEEDRKRDQDWNAALLFHLTVLNGMSLLQDSQESLQTPELADDFPWSNSACCLDCFHQINESSVQRHILLCISLESGKDRDHVSDALIGMDSTLTFI